MPERSPPPSQPELLLTERRRTQLSPVVVTVDPGGVDPLELEHLVRKWDNLVRNPGELPRPAPADAFAGDGASCFRDTLFTDGRLTPTIPEGSAVSAGADSE